MQEESCDNYHVFIITHTSKSDHLIHVARVQSWFVNVDLSLSSTEEETDRISGPTRQSEEE